MPRQGSQTASGKSLRPVVLGRGDLSPYQFRFGDRNTQKAVRTKHQDKKTGALQVVELGNDELSDGLPAAHTDRHIYPNKSAAEQAAKARLAAFNRSTAGVRLEMAGRTDVFAERLIVVPGMKSGLDGEYLAEAVEQIISNKRPVIERAFLEATMAHRQIDTPKRQAAFLAQVGHESGQLQYVRELGGDQYLSKYDTGSLASRLGNTPAPDGDGQRYRGRGLIQVTGRNNYLRCSLALFGDERLLRTPELLELPQWAAESAAWFWWVRELNVLADRDEFETITRKINGGLNGLQDRLQLWERARALLCVSST